MESLILVMLLICFLNSLFSLFSKRFGLKPNMSNLYCGITAYVGSVPANPEIIKMIMIYNEERGEDSTGWAVNNEVIKDTVKVRKFITEHDLTTDSADENYAIIAHARKSSSGAKWSKELAHPFGIYKDDIEKEKYDLILAMNGTLTILNTKLIAEKYDLDYVSNKNSDTQILAKAMVKAGSKDYIKLLEAYDGTATLVFMSPKIPNTLFVYKDSERPLFYWNYSEEQMYISSMEEPLLAIGAGKIDIKSFEGEHLYTIADGKIKTDTIVVRNPLKPKLSPVHVSNHNNYNGKRKHYQFNETNYHDYSDFSVNENTIVSSLLTKLNESENHKPKGHNIVYTINEKYHRNGHPITGKFYINKSGKIKDEAEFKTSNDTIKVYYFVNGYMCKGGIQYDKIMSKCSDKTGGFDLKKFKTIQTSEFVDYYEYPTLTIVNKTEKWVLNKEYEKKVKISGDSFEFTPFLSEFSFKLKYFSKWVATTKKLVCENAGVYKVDLTTDLDIEEMKSEECIKESKDYLIEKIKDNESNVPGFYYSAIRLDLWRKNPDQLLREHFFILLISIANQNGVLGEAATTDLTTEGVKSIFSGVVFMEELSKIIVLLRKKLGSSKETNDNDNKIDENLKNFNILDGFTIDDFKEEKLVESVRLANEFFNNQEFCNDVYNADYATLMELQRDWIASGTNAEIYSFFEAVLLCMNVLGKIKDDELLYVLNADPRDTIEKAESLYNSWYSMPDKEDKETPTENAIIGEEIDKEYNDNQFNMEISEVLETMIDITSRMERLDKLSKSESLERLEDKLKENIVYLKKHVIKSELK